MENLKLQFLQDNVKNLIKKKTCDKKSILALCSLEEEKHFVHAKLSENC